MKKSLFIIFSIIFFLQLSSCKLSLLKADYYEIVVKGASFTICWDDNSNRISRNLNDAVQYKIYYRIHGSSGWEVLEAIEASINREFTIDNSKLDYGIYDLGVSSINQYGKESAIHSSLDRSADPFCGWYINWIGSK